MTTTQKELIAVLSYIAEEGFYGVKTNTATLSEYITSLKINNPKSVTHELRRQGLVEITKEPDGIKIILSPKGAHRILKERVHALTIDTSSWDGRWRLVSFDIPRGRDKDRMFLYQKLKSLGFMMIQKSMWAHAHDCYEQLLAIGDYCNLTRYIIYFEISKADPLTTAKLRRHFNV